MDHHNNEKTPKRLMNSLQVPSLGVNSIKKTPTSNFVSKFSLLANNNINQTPSPLLKNRVVRNPFENQLHEKLHMPVTFSPSVFQAPSTPKNNSGKLELFEWTIEELSTLNPVNVIPHETQFMIQNDPEREAEAQAKISSFFSEHQIVPSPLNCQLRKQKIELRIDGDQIYNSTALPDESRCHSISKIRENVKCDAMTQTALSFPPNLPKEVEEMLKKYQLDDGACNSSFKQSDENDGNQSMMMDISTLRRKLFIRPPESPETFNISCTESAFATNLSPAPKTPEMARLQNNLENNSFGSDMFGEISPISLPDGSFNHSSPMASPVSINDVSMASASDVGTRQTPASRRRLNKLKKKNLSNSFSMLQGKFNEEDLSDKENNIAMPKLTENRRFARFDSGFNSSNSNLLNISTEFMQI